MPSVAETMTKARKTRTNNFKNLRNENFFGLDPTEVLGVEISLFSLFLYFLNNRKRIIGRSKYGAIITTIHK